MNNILKRIWVQRVIRMLGVLFFSGMLYRHSLEYAHYPSKALWLMELLLFLLFVVAYLVRRPSRAVAEGLREQIFPFFCAVLPFGLVYKVPEWSSVLALQWGDFLQYAPWNNYSDYWWIQWVMILGTSLTVASLYTLRGSFSIMTEARELVQKGPYRYISHPMYLGEWITAFGSAWLRGGWEKWLVFVVFLLLQWLRLKNEEKKLRQIFGGQYEKHRKKCWIRF